MAILGSDLFDLDQSSVLSVGGSSTPREEELALSRYQSPSGVTVSGSPDCSQRVKSLMTKWDANLDT